MGNFLQKLNRIIHRLTNSLFSLKKIDSNAPLAVDATAWIQPGWDSVIFDAPLAHTIRRQIADISSLGKRRFIVAYIVQNPTDTSQARGELRYVYYDVETGFKSEPVATGVQANWVRAATSSPIQQGTCGPIVAAKLIESLVDYEFGIPQYVTFFSYGLQQNGVSRAKLMRNSWCGDDFLTTHHDVGDGVNPSVGVATFAGETKILVVFGHGNMLVGRFFDSAGMPKGTEFEIATFPEGFSVTNTDIVWNKATNHFIIGFTQNAGLDGGCTVKNVLVTWEGAANEPVTRGRCDPETGGHHTSVAIDNRIATNADGRYAWWHETNPGGGPIKVIELMNSDGEPSGFSANLELSALTTPVAARRESNHSLFGLISGSYVTASTVSPSTPGEKRMAGWSISRNGATQIIGLIAPMDSQAIAVETLETETVLLWRPLLGGSFAYPARITVFSHFQHLAHDFKLLRF